MTSLADRFRRVQERVAEAAWRARNAVGAGAPGRAGFYNFLVGLGGQGSGARARKAKQPGDIGILASTDPVACDQAAWDLVARDLHAHPTRPGVLVLSATFVNLADRAQPYPVVAVTLLDPDNAPLVARAFDPDEYLAGDASALTEDQQKGLDLFVSTGCTTTTGVG